MSAKLLEGKPIADTIHQETLLRVEKLKQQGIKPFLTFILVGENPASLVYISMKDKKAKELGILTETKRLSKDIAEEDLIQEINSLNQDPEVHGILIQAPLPSHISETKIFSTVIPSKDVDGFHPENFGRLLSGDDHGLKPCTPHGIVELLNRYQIPLKGKHIVILGRGNIVGKPLAALLCQKKENANATVTILHSASENIKEHCKRADVLIAAMGQAEMITKDYVTSSTTVIDVGVNRVTDDSHPKGYRIVGDVNFKELSPMVHAITPNPGGVGPMTIAMLMSNLLSAAERQLTSSRISLAE
jgi:methylenetetrahydrofolate dehydrogenase (NADP+)/methenyltetrahydrofolate cyclohydrolase